MNLPEKNNITISTLPYYISKGNFLGEIINRVEGKSEPIKGLIKGFSSKFTKLNLTKTLDYINSIEKIEKSKLCSVNEIINKNDTGIWELLSALYKYYYSK